MPTKIHKNSFQGGMDKDTDPAQVENFKYLDGYNLSLSQDGREKKLSAILGTTTLKKLNAAGITRGNVHIMGMYEATVSLDTADTLMVLVFYYDGTDFKIFATPEDTSYAADTLTEKYEMYTKTAALTDADMFVDCVVHKEGGTSYAYFTDAEQSPKKLPLVITTGEKGDKLNGGTSYYDEEIEMLRTGFDGNISAVAVTENGGGDLLCGTYQFAVRLFNSSLNKYTKWSLLTQPVVVRMPYVQSVTAGETSYGGVGYVSTSDIDLTISTITNYTTQSLYDYFQIAVVENIDGAVGSTLTAKVLQPEAYAGTTETYNYTTNKRAKELIHIDELTVDDAAIKNLKSLAIKNNRMLSLNVNYHPLNYNNGNPTVGSGTIPIQKVFTNEASVPYRDSDNATNFVGHFRDELYRYAAVYEDKYGNYSKPYILNFDSATVTANSAAAGSIDWRFPARTDGTYGTLLGTGGDAQALGLGIRGLVNHPTWAVAVHIVRVPRKKKIQFQTPLIPSVVVQPAKATGGYPAQRKNEAGTDLDILNVEATNPDGAFVPKNFFHVVAKNMFRFGDLEGTTVNRGTVYATQSSVNKPTRSFKVVNSLTGFDYEILFDASLTSIYTHTATDVMGLQIQQDGILGEYQDMVSGDDITVTLTRRARGTSDAFGSPVVYTSYNYNSTAETGDSLSLVLGTYDYLITITDD